MNLFEKTVKLVRDYDKDFDIHLSRSLETLPPQISESLFSGEMVSEGDLVLQSIQKKDALSILLTTNNRPIIQFNIKGFYFNEMYSLKEKKHFQLLEFVAFGEQSINRFTAWIEKRGDRYTLMVKSESNDLYSNASLRMPINNQHVFGLFMLEDFDKSIN